MVTVSAYSIKQNESGESFITLTLQGDLEMVQSQKTGAYYATARKCSIVSTFNETVAASLVGSQIPGKIIRQECDAYDFIIPDTGEVIELKHRWVYVPEEAAASRVMKSQEFKADERTFSSNGVVVEA